MLLAGGTTGGQRVWLSWYRGVVVAAAATMLLFVGLPAREAQAAPVVTTIGSDETGSPLTISVPSAVQAGHSIVVVTFQQNGSSAILAAPTCSDPINGAYNHDHSTTTVVGPSAARLIV